MRRAILAGLAIAGVCAIPAAASADTYIVTNTADTGAGSLRQAITAANGHAGPDTIAFNVTGAGCVSGICTIVLASQLPVASDTVLIDGYTQPGTSPNTHPTGAIDAVLKIVLSGGAVSGGFGIGLGAANSTVRGLVINGGFFGGVSVSAANVSVRGCFIGTDATGMTPVANGRGVYGGFSGATGLTVGGPAPADRNLIAGQIGQDIWLDNTPNATIEGNLLGTNVTGAAAIGVLPNFGIILTPGAAPVIRGNVVAGGTIAGISIGNATDAASETIVQGNFIGTDVTGTVNLGNPRSGIFIWTTDVTVGGTGPGEANVIAFNGGAGVLLVYYVPGRSGRCTIRGNSIHSNHQVTEIGNECLGIDFQQGASSCDPTLNDLGDADSGPNGGQNFPIITSAVPSGGSTTIQGKLNSLANTTFVIDFYSNPACVGRPQGFLEGRTYLGTANVTTDGSGNATINSVLPVAIAANQPVTATATDPAGNTSEFSQRIVLSSSPPSGPPGGGTGLSLSGFHFLAGATVSIGGAAASGVVVSSYNQITANTPSRPPGSLNDIMVFNTDGTSGTLRNGWVADFLDVPANAFKPFVTKLVANGITAGCGGGNYCPDTPVTRAQMAVFLLRGKYGLCFFPPAATGTVFGDVPSNSFAAAWIEELSDQEVTAGCGGGNYCPGSPVTRAQMAVFLLRMLNGPTYVPPPCVTPTFNDVPCSNGFAPWIEDLVDRGITAGCGGGNYCPNSVNTRGQMSAFISTTFQLP